MTEARLIMLALGCFLLTWGISLFARAAADRWVKLPLGPAIQRRAVRLGLIAVPFGLAWAACGVLLDWLWTGRPLGHDLGGQATLGAIGVLVMGAGLAIGGWWFDRSRGRERCPSCWFDLEAVAKRDADGTLQETLCTECGRKVTRWKDLYRTRRERTLLWSAAACLPLAYAVIAAPRVIERGVTGLIPSTVLIAALKYMPRELVIDSQQQASSLHERMGKGQLWRWQYAWLESKAESLRRSPSSLVELRISDEFLWHRWDPARYAGLLLSGLQSQDQGESWYAQQHLSRLDGKMSWDAGTGILAGREEEVMRFWSSGFAHQWRWWMISHCGKEMERWWPEIDAEVRKTTDIDTQYQQLVAAAVMANHFEGARRTLDWCVSGPTALSNLTAFEILANNGHAQLVEDLRKRRELQNVIYDTEADPAVQLAAARQVAELGPAIRSYVALSYLMLRADWTKEELEELRALRERVRFKALE